MDELTTEPTQGPSFIAWQTTTSATGRSTLSARWEMTDAYEAVPDLRPGADAVPSDDERRGRRKRARRSGALRSRSRV